MAADVIGVGMVGLGLAAEAHVAGYGSHARARVVAACDLDRRRAEDFARRHRIANTYTDYAAMLERDDIDLIDVTTPTHLHAPMCLAALSADKHVQCEKPFCRSAAEGEPVIALARRRAREVAVGETYVFLTSHRAARELIEEGAIGRPLQIRQRHGAWLAREDAAIRASAPDRGWRVDAERSGGGPFPWIFDHAVHFFAAAEYFALDRPIVEIYAVAGRTPPGRRPGGAAHDPYASPERDIPIITFKFADPACQGVWMRAERLNGKYDHMRGFSTTVIGEHGMIEVLGEWAGNLFWQGRQQHLLLHREGRETAAYRFDEGGDELWQSEVSYYRRGHVNQVHHLIDALLDGAAPRYRAEDGLRAVRCTLAAICSAESGRPVRVDDLPTDYAAYA